MTSTMSDGYTDIVIILEYPIATPPHFATIISSVEWWKLLLQNYLSATLVRTVDNVRAVFGVLNNFCLLVFLLGTSCERSGKSSPLASLRRSKIMYGQL